MKRGETIFDFLSHVMIIFGSTTLILDIFCILFGEEAKNYSSMFALGRSGLSVEIMFQFFLVSVIITVLRFLFFTDRWIKNLSLTLRTLCMFALVLTTIIVFILLFDWFPADDMQAWASFVLCFAFSIAVSTGISVLKEKTENKKMEKALERIKAEKTKRF